MLTAGPVIERVAEQTGLSADDLEQKVAVSTQEGSYFITVRVEDTDPQQAATIANMLMVEFETFVQERASGRAEMARSRLDAQIADLEQRLVEIDEETSTLQGSSDAEDAAVVQRIEDLRLERVNVAEALSDLNTQALTIDSQVMAASPLIEQVAEAKPADDPFAPTPLRAAMIGAFAGLMLGIIVVVLLEYMDNTVKPELNVSGIAGAPLLASIAAMPKLQAGEGQLYSVSQPKSPAAEAIRLLRTNLEFASAANPIGSMIVTSPGPGEGKSTTTANLAVTMAQAGLWTVIVDADLRRPTQHRIFGVSNDQGLTSLLTHPDQQWEQAAQMLDIPGLFIVPSGPIPPNPSDLLSSTRFKQLMEKIAGQVDVVLIDSPPILAASDALAISAHADGVLLVCQSHTTRVDALKQSATTLQAAGTRIIGVVMNRQKGQAGGSYYSDYYGYDEEE
jgi:non-specific protein-tyrosine kinase